MRDDKGSTLIAVWGLPPKTHEDDPLRAVKASIAIHRALEEQNVSCSIGITTGRAFCGAVGSDERREYAMVGDVINMAARYMGQAMKTKTDILCDKATFQSCRKVCGKLPNGLGITFRSAGKI